MEKVCFQGPFELFKGAELWSYFLVDGVTTGQRRRRRTLTWTTGCLTCVRIHMGVGHTDSESAQYFWLGKILTKFSCAPDGVRTTGLQISSQTLYQWASQSPQVTSWQVCTLYWTAVCQVNKCPTLMSLVVGTKWSWVGAESAREIIHMFQKPYLGYL